MTKDLCVFQKNGGCPQEKIRTVTLPNLRAMPLDIDSYQRPYTWKTDFVEQLLESLEAAAQKENTPCVMGTIILHCSNEKCFVVDGQQRLITFWLISRVALEPKDSQPWFSETQFFHRVSQENVWNNFHFIDSWWKRKLKRDREKKEKLLAFLESELLKFVLLKTDSLDEAFVFFDSQNSRGKALEDFDLIKANHLRYTKDALQKECAESWEKIERDGSLVKSGRKDSGRCPPTMKYLMTGLMALPRQFSHNRQLSLREEFNCQRRYHRDEGGDVTYYPLSNYTQPPIFTSWRYEPQANSHGSGLELIQKCIDANQKTRGLKFESDSKRFMPFQLTQAIEGGEQFFWFVEKYQQLYLELFVENPFKPIIPPLFRKLMDAIIRCRSTEHVRKCYEATMLFFYDKFGAEDWAIFLKAALYFEHAIFHLQVKQVVQERSIPKFLREVFNPFAVIQEASSPIHIFEAIEKEEGKWYLILGEKGPAKDYYKGIKEFLETIENLSDCYPDVQKMAKRFIDLKETLEG
ncbi:MAG TPA: DUF262 domain-containing protein [Candidatus Rifleibacterium sp.]|nr:DUF262 domain-containing protein [Candidatus Rifleibacterium sp.]HPT47994.1 DUF262 domain-containing protein [Candidatus Rifleibacterium sp.]